MLDTKCLARRLSGGKEESYWPVSVAKDAADKHVFHCMIIKGTEKYPTNPPPMLSEFPLEVPLSSAIDKAREREKEKDVDEMSDDEDAASRKAHSQQQELESQFVLSSILHSQLSETLSHTRPTAHQKQDLAAKEMEIDKTLIQLLGLECAAVSEDRGMKALELVTLMKDSNGKMLEFALKVAARYRKENLMEKIRDLQEKRLVGGGDDDEEFV